MRLTFFLVPMVLFLTTPRTWAQDRFAGLEALANVLVEMEKDKLLEDYGILVKRRAINGPRHDSDNNIARVRAVLHERYRKMLDAQEAVIAESFPMHVKQAEFKSDGGLRCTFHDQSPFRRLLDFNAQGEGSVGYLEELRGFLASEAAPALHLLLVKLATSRDYRNLQVLEEKMVLSLNYREGSNQLPADKMEYAQAMGHVNRLFESKLLLVRYLFSLKFPDSVHLIKPKVLRLPDIEFKHTSPVYAALEWQALAQAMAQRAAGETVRYRPYLPVATAFLSNHTADGNCEAHLGDPLVAVMPTVRK